MLSGLFRNKYFVSFIIITLLLYVFSAKTARADLEILGWVLTALSLLFFVISLGTCVVCLLGVTAVSTLPLTIASFTLTLIWEDMIIGFLLTTISIGVGTGLCVGLSGVLGGCSEGESPSLYYIGSGTVNASAPPPKLLNQSWSSTCNSITLNYTVENAGAVSIYRDGTKIYTSETCFPPNSNSTTFSFSYTDNGLNPGTTYIYDLYVSDIIGQTFKVPPPIEATTKTPPNCSS